MYKPIVTFVLLFFAIYMPGLGQTHIQTATLYQTTTSATINRAFPAASTNGNLIIVHLDWGNQSQKVNTVTDNKGNSYAKINGPTNWNGSSFRAELWYAYNIRGGGAAITVTAKLTGAPTDHFQIYISEYSGIATNIDPLDQNSVAVGNSTTVGSGARTTNYANELIYGVSIGASGTLATGAGFVNRSTANSNIVEDKKATSKGSFNASFSSAGGNWVAQMATFISTNSILPVDLLSFTGHCVNNQVVLEWSTNGETNNDHFTIERSDDGYNWQAIGIVKDGIPSAVGITSAVGVPSAVVQNYSYTAAEANTAASYFRLQQTDLDGRSTYFKVIRINTCVIELQGVTIYPNPSNGVSLSGKITAIPNEKYLIEIFDNAGRVVHHSTVFQPAFAVDFIRPLPAGIYYARFSSTAFSAAVPFSTVVRFLVKP